MRDQCPPTPPRFRSFRQTGPGWLWGWPAGVKPRRRPQSTSSSTPAVLLLPPLRGMGGHLWSLKPRGIPLAGPCSWTISSTGECWSCPRAGARGLRAAGGEPPSQPFNKDLRPCSDSASPSAPPWLCMGDQDRIPGLWSDWLDLHTSSRKSRIMYPFYRLQEKHPSHSCVLNSAKLSLKTPPIPIFYCPTRRGGCPFHSPRH